MVYATLAIALRFVPIVTIKGVARRLFGPLGLANVVTTLTSLVVALVEQPVDTIYACDTCRFQLALAVTTKLAEHACPNKLCQEMVAVNSQREPEFLEWEPYR